MNCQGQRTLYLKANGDMPCEDDAGEYAVLAHLQAGQKVSLDAILGNARFRHLQGAMARGSAPWPLVCERCAFFRRGEAHDPWLSSKLVEKIQVETSLACGLRCGGCTGLEQIATRSGPHVLQLPVFTALLDACRDEGYLIDWIEYCGQGEPLNHRNFRGFLSAARDILPGTRQRLITNGNHDFDARMPDLLPDEIMVSCDGARPQSYAAYRTNGRFETVRRFMERAAARRAQAEVPCRLIWKYILFAHNDSDGEIIAAQEMAQTIGVDQLLFVSTHSANRSGRRVEDLPLTWERAAANATPVLYRTDMPGDAPGDARRVMVHAVIDEFVRRPEGTLAIRGWALTEAGLAPDRGELLVDGAVLGLIATGGRRPDVGLAVPQWESAARAGFHGQFPVLAARLRAVRNAQLQLGFGPLVYRHDLDPAVIAAQV